jgi:hypothetical protein
MDIPQGQDDFRWFGEGFDGFPKRLPDDTVHYAIHVIDDKLSQQKISAELRQVHQHLKQWSKELLSDYIWQREAFSVELKFKEGKGFITSIDLVLIKIGRWSLSGQTNFGDSIADEWLIVYILRELSKHSPELWIRVFDNDGEFLLIEAANVLPKWLKPDISENRVSISPKYSLSALMFMSGMDTCGRDQNNSSPRQFSSVNNQGTVPRRGHILYCHE